MKAFIVPAGAAFKSKRTPAEAIHVESVLRDVTISGSELNSSKTRRMDDRQVVPTSSCRGRAALRADGRPAGRPYLLMPWRGCAARGRTTGRSSLPSHAVAGLRCARMDDRQVVPTFSCRGRAALRADGRPAGRPYLLMPWQGRAARGRTTGRSSLPCRVAEAVLRLGRRPQVWFHPLPQHSRSLLRGLAGHSRRVRDFTIAATESPVPPNPTSATGAGITISMGILLGL